MTVEIWIPSLLWTLASLLLFAITFVGFTEPFDRLIVVARWVFATLLDAVGLGHILLPVDTAQDDVRWEATIIHIDSWYLDHVDIVLASFWTGLTCAVGLALFSGFLVLAWRSRKRWSISGQNAAPSVPARVGYGHASLPIPSVALPPAHLHEDGEKDEPVSQEEEAPAIDKVFGDRRFLMGRDEVRCRKPVARHHWDYRPS